MLSPKHPCSNHVNSQNAIGPSSPRPQWPLIDPRHSLVTLIGRQYRTGAVTGFIFLFPQPLVLVWEFKRTDSDNSWNIVVCIISSMLFFNLSHIYLWLYQRQNNFYIFILSSASFQLTLLLIWYKNKDQLSSPSSFLSTLLFFSIIN